MLGAAGVALSAVSAVIPGMSGAENLGHAAQILRYGQSLAGMGLALGPKVGAVLASPKGKRKAGGGCPRSGGGRIFDFLYDAWRRGRRRKR